MKFKLSGAAVLAALFVLALFAGMATGGGGTPPGQDPCSHGATGKDCRPDPQPDNGKDCLHHGQQGGVNEDHCGGATTTTPTTTTTPSTPTVTVTTPGQTTTLPGTTTTTPGKTTTVTTTTPGPTVTVTTPGGTQTVTQTVAGPTVTVTGPTVTAPAQAVSPATATARTKIRYRVRTRTITKTHTVIRWKTRTRIVVHHEKCKPHIVTVCPRGMTGKPPRCGAAANG